MGEMSDKLYHIFRAICTPLKYRVQGVEHIDQNVPAVFIANHAKNEGPFQTLLTLPVRVYPWATVEMTDPARIQKYIYTTFIAPVWHMRGRVGEFVSKYIGLGIGALVRGVNCIPIDRAREQYQQVFERSLMLLERGRNLLIFPEHNASPGDPVTQMRPFMPGFIQLSALFRHKTGKELPLYPVAVVPSKRIVAVGEARYLCASDCTRSELLEMPGLMQHVVSNLYLSCLDKGRQLSNAVVELAAPERMRSSTA